MNKIAVLVAPFRDRDHDDVNELDDVKLRLLMRGWVPVFLPDTLKDVLDDYNADQREMAIGASSFWCASMAKQESVEMIVVGDKMTQGMKSDVQAWLSAGGPPPKKIGDDLELD